MSGKSLRNYTFYSHQTKLIRRFKPCERARLPCEVCYSIKDTTKESEETFDILKSSLEPNSNNVIYLFECGKGQFKFSCVRSTVTKVLI